MQLFNSLKFVPVASLAAASALGLGWTPAQAAITTFGCASASQCTLQELFDGGAIQIDDQVFDNWLTNPFQFPLDYSQVTVTPLADDPLNPGLRYDWGQQLTGSGVNVFVSSTFVFNVSTWDGSPRIKDNSLKLLDYEVTGDGSLLVLEFPADLATGNPLVEIPKMVGTNLDPDGDGIFEDILFSEIEFSPQSAIEVVTTIFSQTSSNGGTFALRSFEQRFSQTSVPEGSAGWGILLITGALAVRSAGRTILNMKPNGFVEGFLWMEDT